VETASREIFDVAVIGCGPAGLSAAVNAKIRNKTVVIYGGEFCSPKMYASPQINNYLGFPAITGKELRENFLEHVRQMGLFVTQARVDGVFPEGDIFNIMIKNEFFPARSVIIATGVTHAKYLPGEQELLGSGVGYCATCDGPLYKGKDIAIIGYTREGEEEANFLAEICRTVYYLPLHQERGHLDERIRVVGGKPKAISGEDHVTHLVTTEGKLPVSAVFLIREVTPVQELVPGLALADNVITVNRNMETNIPGIYAAGDCTGAPYQLAKAAGEGQVAALGAVRYLDSLRADKEPVGTRRS